MYVCSDIHNRKAHDLTYMVAVIKQTLKFNGNLPGGTIATNNKWVHPCHQKAMIKWSGQVATLTIIDNQQSKSDISSNKTV